MRQVYLEESVYEICKTCPEIKDILFELGFKDIVKPGMLQTAGRFMTIPAGAKMKNISMDAVLEKLRERGFEPMEGKHEQRD